MKITKIIFCCMVISLIISVIIGCGGSSKSSNGGIHPPGSSNPPGNLDVNLVGFAKLNGGTTGGAGGPSVTVTNGIDLQNAIKQGGPRIIYVNGTITPSNSGSLSKIDVKEVNNISIIGAGANGEFDGIGIKVWKASNIIISNIKVHHVLIGDKDCISIEGPSNNIWVDHCELYNQFQGVGKDDYDALLDAKAESAYLTYSWNKLHDSWKASLNGSSESDYYDRRVTYHHNSFININSRLPLYRGGQGHIYNNYYQDIHTSGVNSRLNAQLRVENNVFINVKNPVCSLDSATIGYWDVRGNIFNNCAYSDGVTGPPISTCIYDPPYEYSLDPVEDVQTIVAEWAGVNKIDWSIPGGPGSTPTNPTNPPQLPEATVLWEETFDRVPDGTNIRNATGNLDNPSSFDTSKMSGALTVNGGELTTGKERFIFATDLTNATHLFVTIKNPEAVANLTLCVGDSYETGGAVGDTGYRAHGQYNVNNTNYQVLPVTLNSTHKSSNKIQFRGVVGTSGTAGLIVDKIQVVEAL